MVNFTDNFISIKSFSLLSNPKRSSSDNLQRATLCGFEFPSFQIFNPSSLCSTTHFFSLTSETTGLCGHKGILMCLTLSKSDAGEAMIRFVSTPPDINESMGLVELRTRARTSWEWYRRWMEEIHFFVGISGFFGDVVDVVMYRCWIMTLSTPEE